MKRKLEEWGFIIHLYVIGFLWKKLKESCWLFGEHKSSSFWEPNDSFQLHNCATLANRNSPSHKCFSICQKVSTDAKTTNPSSDIFGMSSLFIFWYFYSVLVVYELSTKYLGSNWNRFEFLARNHRNFFTFCELLSSFHC